MTRLISLGLVVLAVAGCTPDLEDRAFLVDGPRLLAIASTPAEAEPPAAVTLRALYVDENGERDQGDLEWAFCVARRTLTDRGTVSPSCLSPGGEGLVSIGEGTSAQGMLPMDACRLFGPDRPLPADGEPAGRPVDPDPSGGYYQPIRLLVRGGGDGYSIGATRLSCGTSGANAEIAAEYGARHRINENPAITSLSIVRDGRVEPITKDTKVAAGAEVTLRASFPACPTAPACGDGVCGIDEDATACEQDCKAPKGCAGAEQYVVFDPESRTLATRRESIRISWFATGGKLQDDVVGRAADESANEIDNLWVAPTGRGPTRLWLVIRDDRGGIGWVQTILDVEE